MRVLLLVTDAYGGHGGISYYNRCLIEAMVEIPEVEEVVVIPRVARFSKIELPPKVRFLQSSIGNKGRYAAVVAAQLTQRFDLVICGHVNLLPLAFPFALLKQAPLVLQVHGIDVWQEPKSWLLKRMCRAVNRVWSVSEFTRDRMNVWAALPMTAYTVIPNMIDVGLYGMSPRRSDLLERYRLHGKKVVLTLARLSASERYKGIDELLELFPTLIEQEPTLTYLIVGDGDDLHRLQAKAKGLGLADHVVFCGYVPEDEKADHLRLADVFALPGRGEGFGIVLLEAMACGIPVVGSCLDGTREALRGGALGELANPDVKSSVVEAVLRACRRKKEIPAGLEYFDRKKFNARIASTIRDCVFHRQSTQVP